MDGLTEWALEGEQKGEGNRVCETEEDASLPSISICQYAQSGQNFCQTGWHRRSWILLSLYLFRDKGVFLCLKGKKDGKSRLFPKKFERKGE